MSATPDRPRKRFRWFTAALLALLLVTAGAFVLYRQWTAVPAHVRQVRAWMAQTPEAQRDELARQVEMRLPTDYTRRIEPGTDGLRTLDASFEEINAWLGQRLERYLANQGVRLPAGVGAVMVAPRDGQLVVAADVDLPQLRQIVSVYFDLIPPPPEGDLAGGATAHGDATADGSLPGVPWSVKITRITAGNVPLPPARLLNVVRQHLDDKTLAKPGVQAVLDAVAHGRAIPLPVLKVDAVRRAQLREVEVDEVAVRATLRVFRDDEEAGAGAAPAS